MGISFSGEFFSILEITTWFFSLTYIYMKCYINNTSILRKSFIHWMNLMWSWLVIHLMCYIIMFVNILFGTFASIFINYICFIVFPFVLIKFSFRNSCSNQKQNVSQPLGLLAQYYFIPINKYQHYPWRCLIRVLMYVGYCKAIMSRNDQNHFLRIRKLGSKMSCLGRYHMMPWVITRQKVW